MAEGVRVLIVDDESMMRELLEAMVADGGYEVELAEDGQSALTAIRRQAPDLVLTDLRMPVMSGWELIAALKDVHPQPPVVAMSGMGTEEPPGLRAIGSHVVGYISKPFSGEELLATLATAFDIARERARPGRVPGERREHPRRPLVVPVTLFTADGTPAAVGQIVNLGPGGAQIQLGAALHTGAKVALGFDIPGGHGPFHVEAEIQWNSKGQVGLLFDGLGESDRTRLTALLAED